MAPQDYYSKSTNDFLGTHPMGSGPYKFVEYLPGQRVVIERNDAYWGQKAPFKQIIVRLITEPTTAISELLAGNAQVVHDIDPDTIDAVTRSSNAEVRTTPNSQCLEVRMDSLGRGGPNPFKDKRVRYAASYAIDREAIAKNLLRGYSKVQATNIGPLMLGHDPSVQGFTQDLAKGKQLLAEAGYPNGFDTKFKLITVSGFGDARAIAQAVVADLAKVGIRCTIEQIPATQSTATSNAGQAGPIFLGANQNGGFFDGGFGFFYLRKSILSSYYYSDQLESLATKIEGETDPEAKKKLISDVQKILREEAPYIWGWSGTAFLAADKRVDARPFGDFYRIATYKSK
jgi:peptide/nickel transport system substrate-binding protein